MQLVARVGARCALCHDALPPVAVTCPDCRTLVHEECQTDRCPTLGCESERSWLWTDEVAAPAQAAPARRRCPRAAALTLVLGLLAAAGLLPCGSPGRTQPAPVAVSTPERSAWDRFGIGSRLLTRSTRTALARETVWECREGGCVVRVGWSGPHRSSHTKRYTLLARGHRYSLVETSSLYRHHVTEQGVPRLAQASEGVVLEERRGVACAAPAGVFSCTYRRTRGRGPGGHPALVETWSHPDLPLPVRRRATWLDPRLHPVWRCGVPVVEVEVLGVIVREPGMDAP